MRMDNIITTATDQLLWPVLRRVLVALAFAILAVIAVYHLTIAGNIALEHSFGDLNARLIIGGTYAALALISLIVLWAMRGKPAKLADSPALKHVRETHLVMLVEAAMLGYTLGRKGQRAR
jgi:type VI protein secretion system component VasK